MKEHPNRKELGRDGIQVIATATLQDALRAILGFEDDTSTVQFAHVVPVPNAR